MFGGEHVGGVELVAAGLGGVELPDVFADQPAVVVVGPQHHDLRLLQVHRFGVDVEPGGGELGAEGLLVADAASDDHVVADGDVFVFDVEHALIGGRPVSVQHPDLLLAADVTARTCSPTSTTHRQTGAVFQEQRRSLRCDR